MDQVLLHLGMMAPHGQYFTGLFIGSCHTRCLLRSKTSSQNNTKEAKVWTGQHRNVLWEIATLLRSKLFLVSEMHENMELGLLGRETRVAWKVFYSCVLLWRQQTFFIVKKASKLKEH